MSASDVAIATIKLEHRSLGTVLHTLLELLKKIVAGHAAPDFALLAVALYYIDDFPERCHHPKEEEYLFKRMRLRSTEFDAVLERLQSDHARSEREVSELHRKLVHYQAGASDGLRQFQEAVNSYATDMLAHFVQEDDLLARARSVLTEDDWALVVQAFAANDDPLFGNNHRLEFTHLYQRILLMAPQKFKSGLRDGQMPPMPPPPLPL